MERMNGQTEYASLSERVSTFYLIVYQPEP